METEVLTRPGEVLAASADEPRSKAPIIVEISAVAFTIGCVWLTGKGNISCWPVGIVGCLLYGYVFLEAKLYSDVLLQAFFLVSSIYGWYNWGNVHNSQLEVTRLSPALAAGWLTAAAVGVVSMATFMKRRTDAALPFWDAATTVLSIIAQLLLTRMILESWVLWIVVDVIAVGVYMSRHLYMTAALYALLLVLATEGLIEWL